MAVAVGISYTEHYLNSAPYGMSAYTATSGTLSVVCGRLSFSLSLKVLVHNPWALRAWGACSSAPHVQRTDPSPCYRSSLTARHSLSSIL